MGESPDEESNSGKDARGKGDAEKNRYRVGDGNDSQNPQEGAEDQ